MSGVESRAAVAEIAADQWGLLTTAQAVAAGVPRMMLSRMAERGELERLVQGVYATPAAVGDELTSRRVAWLSLDPGTPAYLRLERPEAAGVVSHASAAAMHGLGDILEPQIEMTLPVRYRSRRDGLRVHRAVLEPGDVTLVEGLPATTAARTVADLVRAGHDRDHVASVVADALRKDLTSLSELEGALEGVEQGRTGAQVLSELMATARLDLESLAEALMASSVGQAATRAMASNVSDWLLKAIAPLAESARARALSVEVGDQLRESMGSSLATAELRAQMQRLAAQMTEQMRDGSMPDLKEWAADVARRLQPSEQRDLVNTWQALRLSEQLAGRPGDDDEDDDVDEHEEATR